MFLFLDFDGVMNDHVAMPNGYNGILRDCVHNLNWLLDEEPKLQLVITSAWRYMMLKNDMTLDGFEFMLGTHGFSCRKRIHGYTERDDVEGSGLSGPPWDRPAWEEVGLKWRVEQIRKYVAMHRPRSWAVVDDLNLQIENFESALMRLSA